MDDEYLRRRIEEAVKKVVELALELASKSWPSPAHPQGFNDSLLGEGVQPIVLQVVENPELRRTVGESQIVELPVLRAYLAPTRHQFFTTDEFEQSFSVDEPFHQSS